MPPETYYSRTGRGYPDLAAVSNHYWVVNNMVPVPGVLGTSASCPVVAGILAHVNDHRLAGKGSDLYESYYFRLYFVLSWASSIGFR